MPPRGVRALGWWSVLAAHAHAVPDPTSLFQLTVARSDASGAADLAPAARARGRAQASAAQAVAASARISTGTAEHPSLSGLLPPEPITAVRKPFNRADAIPAVLGEKPKRAAAVFPEPLDLESLVPTTWACLGPVVGSELGVEPIAAFGAIKPTLLAGVEKLERAMDGMGAGYAARRQGKAAANHSEIMESLAKANLTQPSKALQDSLPRFPTEYGPTGKTLWALAHADLADSKVYVNFTEAAHIAGITDPLAEDMHKTGWAIASVTLSRDTTVLIRCNEAFMVDNDLVLRVPDAYEEHRAVSVYHMRAGRHRLFVRFRSAPFWCDVNEDTGEGRRKMSTVAKQSEGESPLLVLSDSMMSDVVEGRLASPYVAVPVVNVAAFPLRIKSAEVVAGPPGLQLRPLPAKEEVPIVSGQSYVAGFMLTQGSRLLPCEENQLKLTLALHPERKDGQALTPMNVTLVAQCIAPRSGGYKVTFLDYDSSVQHMWVAPPNVSALPEGSCPPSGCPVLLSLHGADVIVSANWGHNYAKSSEGGAPFPYPAWLVEPSNRYHWGTDWEGPGYDDGIRALEYVHSHLPGIGGVDKPHMRLDADRMVLTGHSMGGHGCLVFSTHDPDRLLASLCGACWASQSTYVRSGGSVLLDEPASGLLRARMAEHASDLLARNFRGVPLKIVYGDRDDNVPPREPRYMTRLVDSFSGSTQAVQVGELPGVAHWFTQNIPEVAGFLGEHLSPAEGENASWALPPLPEQFEFAVASVSSFGTKGNLKVLQLADAARPGKLFVRRCAFQGESLDGACGQEPVALAAERERDDAAGDQVWYIETFNVRRLTFRNPPVEGRPLPQHVVVDGMPFDTSSFTGAFGSHLCLARKVSQGVQPYWKICRDTRWESLQRAGPRTDDGPFHNALRRAGLCIAHGSDPGEAELALVVANKLYFVSRYAVPIIAAVDENVTVPRYCDSANILYIGHPQDNALLAQQRCAFPYITFHARPSRGFTLGGMAYRGPGIGLIGLGRLPSGRLALVLLGTNGEGLMHAGNKLPVTSFRDGADYMVLGRDTKWLGEGGILAAGYLDPLWRASGSSWAEPEHSVERWEGIGLDGSPEDPQCADARAALLQSDEEITAMGRAAPTFGSPIWVALLTVSLLHVLSVCQASA